MVKDAYHFGLIPLNPARPQLAGLFIFTDQHAMNGHIHLPQLRFKLQSLGALRPEAWQAIMAALQYCLLKPDERFNRRDGQLAWVADGLLKEYDAEFRKRSAIVNFNFKDSYIITRHHNKTHYLKACTDTSIYYLNEEQLIFLFQQFKELLSIYKCLCGEYDDAIAYRQLILEESGTLKRIQLFKERFQKSLNYIKKKDMANYLQLNYTHLLHVYKNQL